MQKVRRRNKHGGGFHENQMGKWNWCGGIVCKLWNGTLQSEIVALTFCFSLSSLSSQYTRVKEHALYKQECWQWWASHSSVFMGKHAFPATTGISKPPFLKICPSKWMPVLSLVPCFARVTKEALVWLRTCLPTLCLGPGTVQSARSVDNFCNA